MRHYKRQTDRGKFPREAMLAAVEIYVHDTSQTVTAITQPNATMFVTSYPKLVTFYPRPGLKVTSQTVMFKVKKQNKNTTEFTFPSIGNLDDIVV